MDEGTNDPAAWPKDDCCTGADKCDGACLGGDSGGVCTGGESAEGLDGGLVDLVGVEAFKAAGAIAGLSGKFMLWLQSTSKGRLASTWARCRKESFP